jgi:hypothetical protein
MRLVCAVVPLKKVEEPSYFFRMSKYQERLVAHIKNNPDFIRPDVRRKEILGTPLSWACMLEASSGSWNLTALQDHPLPLTLEA